MPQPSGVADFSATVFTLASEFADITVYTTAGAVVEPHPNLQHRSIDSLLANPERAVHEHDAVLTVLGNSHFHLPFTQLQEVTDTIAIAHDTRMVEFYLALRGPAGVEQVMSRSVQPSHSQHSLDDQMEIGRAHV